jgi:xanthine dehydrogenase YagR molybdenum-binding subunit
MATNESGSVGKPMNRVDGRLKVTGAARYAADWPIDGVTYGVIVQSTIGSGRVASIDASRALKARGVVGVLTPKNAQKLPDQGNAAVNPPAGRVLTLLQDGEVHYNGQPIAVVVADTFEHATDAATMVGVTYENGPLAADFDAAFPSSYPLPEKPAESGKNTRGHYVRGDVDAGLASADVRIDQTYTTPKENHNPMEPHAAIASWDGGQLTVYDTTQYVYGARDAVAKTFGMRPEDVHIISPFVGGGFGCKGSTWSHVLLAAMASQSFKRPVKIVLTRRQMFGPVGGRPQTHQRITLGAKSDGTLTAIRHLTTSHTSFIEDFLEPSGIVTRMLYAVPNLESTHRLLKLNVGTPTYQRAPGEATGTFSVEVAMDELAEKLHMDPLALRLKNYAETDPDTGRPFSSKALKECYRVGAERFGWSKRNAKAGTMRDGKAMVGYGLATATYPTHRSPATVRARLEMNGSEVRAVVQTASQDLGTGTYTIMTQIAADALGLTPGQVRFELGDSHFPKSPVSGGSMSAASTGSAVHVACTALRQKLLALAANDPSSPMHGIVATDIGVSEGRLMTRSDSPATETYAELLTRQPERAVEVTESSAPGEETKQFAMHAFGAVFAEARIDADTRAIRIPRIVGAYGVGRVLNAKLAHSQMISGMVWGVSQALREETDVDPRNGRYVNADLAEYHVPVNADIHDLDVTFVDEDDPHINPIGAKGIGEIGITGVAGAIANAIYNATGVRVRHLPIRLDDLL